ncbi:MAG TPA: excisionase family DNA-binding protein [Chloroflexota bacterium]|nr:excisionase family DNA-binding protein [Chloroflexota bacterium]
MAELTIKEAADRLGVSADTIRRRLKAGEIEGRREPMGSGYRWLVQLPEDAHAAAGGHAGTHTGPETPADLSAAALELERLRAEVAGLERLVEEVSSDRDAWQEQARRSQVMAETAQRLAERAQALALPAGSPEPAATSEHTNAGTETPQGRAEGLWGALRRLVRGG